MPENLDYSDVQHAGQHRFTKAPVLPVGTVGNANFNANDPLAVTSQRHRFVAVYAQPRVAAVAETKVVHVARGAGTIAAVEAGVTVAATGNATMTVDVRKNNTTVLTANIVLDSTNAAYAEEAGVISGAQQSYAVGDVFEVIVVVNAGTGTLGQGLYLDLMLDEAAT